MHRRLARPGIVALGATAAIVGWLAHPGAQPAASPFVIAPGPESAGAVKRGAADLKKAQALARKKQVTEAIAVLERLALDHPAATHDCNLALAYLRAGQLTRAQLMFDVSRQRGSTPPDWCDSDLAGQLAAALRDKGYVPLTLVVSPAGTDLELAGTRLRDLGLVWLAPGTYTIIARAPGMVAQTLPVAVSAPSARAAITLEPPPPPRPPIDAAPPVDAGVAVDAAVIVPPDAAVGPVDVDLPPPPAVARPTRWPAFAAVGVGGVGLGLGLAFHVRALGTKDRANDLPAGSMGFTDARATFGTERALAIGGYAVSAAALGFAAWWWLGHDQATPARTVGLTVDDGTALLTVGGAWP